MAATANEASEKTVEAEHPASLSEARALAANCTRCPLYRGATQTVFGEGPRAAKIMLVGEQPGDKEDIAGKPFVGPAGGMLDAALKEAKLDREQVYVTNAVKHFKYTGSGKKRLHKTPNAREIEACRWWLDLELDFTQAHTVVTMGATALRAVLGKSRSITSHRGRVVTLPGGRALVATVHPSFLLRMPDRERARREFAAFAADLARAREAAR